MPPLDADTPLALLGGLTPASFMRRHWQKRPLLVRQALREQGALLSPRGLFALAARDDVESRLIVQREGAWSLRRGPLARRALPPMTQRGWTLLVQGVDLHVPAAHALLRRFRFVPDARLDDVMVSFASDAGGVGPHVDSYDVFLLQAAGRRRWRVGRAPDATLRNDVPLKMLARFEPEHDWTLEAGDLLYLPPGCAHDGEALGDGCMTCSIGFRAPGRDELARELLMRLADATGDASGPIYRDGRQPATSVAPARIPEALRDFASAAVVRALRRPREIDRALGEYLSEPKPQTLFDQGAPLRGGCAARLDARTRMLYDTAYLYCNGESSRLTRHDARAMRRLADRRALSAAEVDGLDRVTRQRLDAWAGAGWLHTDEDRNWKGEAT